MSELKSSASILKNNFLSYLLAIVVITVLTGILFVVVILGIGVVLWVANPGASPIDSLADLLLSWTIPMSTGDITVIMTNAFFVVIAPLYAVFAWTFAGIYGMTQGFLDDPEASVTNPISFWRKNKGRFLLNGIIMSAISMIPAAILAHSASWFYGFSVPYPLDWSLGLIGLAWFFIVFGFLQMSIPAVAAGKGAFKALKMSFTISARRFGKVFGNWLAYFLLLIIWFVPIIYWGFHHPGATPLTDPIFALCTSLAAVGAFMALFFIVPMMIISMTSIYNESTAE